MAKIKNSKFKNTGILFELLCTRLTTDILNTKDHSTTLNIIQRYFGPKSYLRKELQIYQSLLKEKFKNKEIASKFIDTAFQVHEKLDKKKILSEKYNLVKDINQIFDASFFNLRVNNYKEYASIYKILETSPNNTNLPDIFQARETLLEFITTPSTTTQLKSLYPSLEKEDKNVRILAYKYMVESFNKNYKHLNQSQRQLLKEYITNVNDNNALKNYIVQEIKPLNSKLNILHRKVEDPALQIKIKGVGELLERFKHVKSISDQNVVALLKIYQLIEELENVS